LVASNVCAGSAGSPSFLALSCVGFFAGTAHAAAQDADAGTKTKTLGGVTVTSTAIDDESYHDEPQDSPKYTAPLINTPRSIVIVPKEVIKNTGSATLVEALRTVPGITFGAAEGGNPIGDRPFIRGFDSQGSTFLDGVRDQGAQTREIFAVEQIQVVRGSDSTLSGRGSAGGSLNIVSKLPRENDFVEVAGSYGTADYKRITTDINHKLTDTIGVRLNGMWHDQDVAGRDAIWQKRWGIAPSITFGLGSPTRLTLAYYHLSSKELPDSGIPYLYACSATLCNAPDGYTLSQPAIGTVTTASGQTGTVSRDTFYGLKDRDFRNARTDQATFRVEHDFGSDLHIRNTARFSHNYQAYSFLLPDDSTGNVFGNPANLAAQPGGQVWRRANTRYGYSDGIVDQLDLHGKFHTGSIEHSFALGGEISWQKTDRGAYVLAAGSTITPRCNTSTIARYYCTSLFTPNPNDPWVNYTSDTSNVQTPVVKGAPGTRTINDASTKGLYAFDSIAVTDALIFNLGVRYDNFKSKVTLPVAAGVRPQFERTDGIFNWQAGAVFKPTHNTSLYAVYATSATPPNSLLGEGQEQNSFGTTTTASALGIFNSLKVEKTKSYEVGAKADLLNEALSLNVALFQTDTDNARVTIDANTVAFIGKRKIKGVEFGFNGKITDDWNVFGGYTYLDAKIVDGGFSTLTVTGAPTGTTVAVPSVNTGKQFPQTAKHSFTIWSDYKFLKAFSIGGGAFYTSRVYGGYADNRTAALQSGVVVVSPATEVIARSIPGYWRFDARAGYTINDRIELSVNVQNLTNKTYFSQAYSSHYATIAPGRSAFGTLTVKY
jgi:catecholate siderophore receptor